LVFGLISLLGDVVYEGGRGVIPPFLVFLGASPFIIGLVGGAGDLVSNFLRIASGYLADRTRAYWKFITTGYFLIIAIPLLALASSWELAAALIILERLGKAIRTPARDALLSLIGSRIGVGKTFGIHEFMDQLGAVLGPLAMVLLIAYFGSRYDVIFAWTLIPFTLLMLSLAYLYLKVGREHAEQYSRSEGSYASILHRRFMLYNSAIFLTTLGLVYPLLILYKASEVFPEPWIAPALYLAIQLVDAPAALAAGGLYDRYGIKLLFLPILLSVFPSLLTLLSNDILSLVVASIIYGSVLGMQESIYRAAVASLVNERQRATSYGVFNTFYGLGLMGSGVIFGYLLEIKAVEFIALLFVILAQLSSALLLLRVIQTG